jgi:D-beta-D-heptose 7-phosphate kinase/D-beta-D-heptose 1-phosphate adenosyltransferase
LDDLLHKFLAEDDYSGLESIRIKYPDKRIVLTNGGFSLLHHGHLRYLQESRSMGDLLVVAVNTNKSIESIKSYVPPIPDFERYFHLCSLIYVDYVISFSTSPLGYFKFLRPDIYVKGGDYSIDTINQSERYELERLGVAIKFTGFHAGHSASSFVKQCRSIHFKNE